MASRKGRSRQTTVAGLKVQTPPRGDIARPDLGGDGSARQVLRSVCGEFDRYQSAVVVGPQRDLVAAWISDPPRRAVDAHLLDREPARLHEVGENVDRLHPAALLGLEIEAQGCIRSV